jgi:hypothetical protein
MFAILEKILTILFGIGLFCTASYMVYNLFSADEDFEEDTIYNDPKSPYHDL